MWRERDEGIGIHVWETKRFPRSMTEAVVCDTARRADGRFTGGDIDARMRDVKIVVLARSPQQQSIRTSHQRAMRLERRFLP
ncbi:hypothetical protein WT63_08815 [Burkholderia anthina]|nr:hypothetical protein WT63_08815 [Burkholderia anthina]